MSPKTWGTAAPGVLERLLHAQSPLDRWLYQAESLYTSATFKVVTPEQREALRRFHMEKTRCREHPMLTAAVKRLIIGS